MSGSEMKNAGARPNMTGAHVLAAALKRHGVETIFAQSNPPLLLLAADEQGIRQIGYRTENAGAVMADAYARVSHRVPVITAQNGPAATLLVPGLAEALKASIPIVAIVQDVHSKMTDKNAFQELDHLDLFKGAAKWVRRVSECDRLDDYIDMAFTAAASGRPGPAVLIVPMDVFAEVAGETPGKDRVKSLGHFPLDRTVADPERIARAAELLASAKAPVVIAGGGVHTSGAAHALADFQDVSSIPVATTTMGKGAVDENHPLSIGVIGYFMGNRSRTRHMRDMITGADVVLLVGNRTNQNGTDSWTLYPPDATYIHLDIDGQEIGRNYEPEVRLLGDARLTLEALTAAMKAQDTAKRQATRSGVERRIAEGITAWKQDLETIDYGKSPVRPEAMMRDLDALLPEGAIVVSDASYSSIWIANFLTSRHAGQRFLTPRGLAGLGWGLPFAMGAKLADPEKPVIALVGDGGFAHVWSELETARRMDIPVTVIVLNNQILGYQKHGEKASIGNYTSACDFKAVDHAAIARACGVEGVRVEKPEAFQPALRDAIGSGKTTVIDVMTDERAFPPITMWDEASRLDY